MLEALSFGANAKDSGVAFHNLFAPPVGFPIDLGSTATMNNVTASGVLFHKCILHHACFHIVLVLNCTLSHDSFCIDLGSAATINNGTAIGILFHNCSTYHALFCVDFGAATKTVMASETEMEGSVFLNHMFDDTLDFTGKITEKCIDDACR